MADFISLNGYTVKDGTARAQADANSADIADIKSDAEAAEKRQKAIQLIDSMDIVLEQYAGSEVMGTIAGGDNYTLQGACRLPNGNHLIGFQNTANEALSVLVEITPFTYAVIGRHVLDLGHVNDLTINEKTGYLYCACGNTGEGNNGGKLAEIDLNNWAIINTYDFGLSSGQMWFCSYDPVSELMMVSDYVRMLLVDESMNVVNNVACNFDQGTNYGAIIKQSTTFYKGSLLVLNFLTTSQAQWFPMLAHMVSTWDPYTGELLNTKTIDNNIGYTEIENMIVESDRIIGYAQGLQFSRYRFTTPDTGGYNFVEGNVGVYVEANTDLNTLINIGKYTVHDGTIAASLSNTPFNNGGFDITVRPISSGAIEQRATGAAGLRGKAATRIYNVPNNSWSSWHYDVQSFTKPYIIQTGGVLVEVLPGVITTRDITFDRPMANALVFTQICTTSTATEMVDISAIVENITNTGFQLRMYSEAASSRSPYIRWLALGDNTLD